MCITRYDNMTLHRLWRQWCCTSIYEREHVPRDVVNLLLSLNSFIGNAIFCWRVFLQWNMYTVFSWRAVLQALRTIRTRNLDENIQLQVLRILKAHTKRPMILVNAIETRIRGLSVKFVDTANKTRIKYQRRMKFCINKYQLSGTMHT